MESKEKRNVRFDDEIAGETKQKIENKIQKKVNKKDQYLEAISAYYTLKNTYETQKKSEMRKLYKSSESKQQYKKIIKNFKPTCVNCGEKGGTRFYHSKEFLIAECNATNKCNLAIKIQLAEYSDFIDYDNYLHDKMETIKTNIIKDKLNIIFSLDNEDVLINDFETLKNEFNMVSELKKELEQHKKNRIYTVSWKDYLEFHPEKEDVEKMKDLSTSGDLDDRVEKTELEKIINSEIDINIRAIKNMLAEYKNSDKVDKSKLTEAINIYITQLKPKLDKLRNLLYENIEIEKTDISISKKFQEFEYKLIKNKYSELNRKLIIQNFNLIENNYNDKTLGNIVSREMSRVSKKRGKSLIPKKSGMTLTFSDSVENHFGMNQHGEITEGYSVQDLIDSEQRILEMFPDAKTELINLVGALPTEMQPVAQEAAVLVFRDGVDYMLRGLQKNSIDLYNEHKVLKKDDKYYDTRRKKVLNKNARHNLCFADEDIAPNYEQKQGTVVAFTHVPLTNYIREFLPKIFGEKAAGKKAEGNYYYDLRKTGIGFHGDAERADVIGVRSGEDSESGFPLYYIWYYKQKPVGNKVTIDLTNKDVYIMSEKAVGRDWKKSSLLTLRHAAGFPEKYSVPNGLKKKKKKSETVVKKSKTIKDFMKSQKSAEGEKKETKIADRLDLHNSTDMFLFYSKSKNDFPGYGKNETVSDPTEYTNLSKMKNWRRTLSNMYINIGSDGEQKPLFNLAGFNWASVEHWYHANKYRYKIEEDESYKNFYLGFTFDSNSEYSKDPKKALSIGGKSGRLNGKKTRPTNIVMDPNFENIKDKVMLEGQRAKYNQNETSKMVLLATKKAKLVHRVLRRGSSSVLVPFIDTMEIRESLKNKVAVDLNKSEAETSQQSETSARKVNIDLPDELPSDMVEEDALDINMPERLPDELDETAAVETPIKLS